jgi:PKD repeat protein
MMPRYGHNSLETRMRRLLSRRPGDARSRGQSLVEFALILPVLLVLLLITIDFGRLYLSYITLNNVARVAANFGSTNPSDFTGTPNTATYFAVVNRESAGLNCSLQPDGGGNTPPLPTFPNGTGLNGISVAAMSCNFSMITPFLQTFFGNKPLPISVSADFPVRTGAIANIGGSTTLPPPGSPQAAFNFIGGSGGTVDGSGNLTGTQPVNASVNDTSVNAQTWIWDWGDGTVQTNDMTGPVPLPHTYASPGVYTVTLTVTNTVGTSTVSHTVTVNSAVIPPVAGFYGTPVGAAPQANGGGSSGAPISGSLDLTVNFANTSTGGASAYSWTFGDGGSSTQSSPSHTYKALGVFPVTLTITAPTGGTPSTRSAYVTTGCVVPNFANSLTQQAPNTWTSANFSGSITYQASGSTTTSSTAPNGKKIVSQSPLTGGNFVPATQPSGSWVCGGNITLVYAP